MDIKQTLDFLPSYHRWAYEILFKGLDQINESDYFAKNGLFFKSIHGTLNHLYLGDSIWYCRFAGQEHHFESVNDISFDNYARGKELLLERCDLWMQFFKQLPSQLPETIMTTNFRGEERVTPFVPTLMHVFNHATHHRGQISAALTQCGVAAPEMDLLYYLIAQNNKT